MSTCTQQVYDVNFLDISFFTSKTFLTALNATHEFMFKDLGCVVDCHVLSTCTVLWRWVLWGVNCFFRFLPCCASVILHQLYFWKLCLFFISGPNCCLQKFQIRGNLQCTLYWGKFFGVAGFYTSVTKIQRCVKQICLPSVVWIQCYYQQGYLLCKAVRLKGFQKPPSQST